MKTIKPIEEKDHEFLLTIIKVVNEESIKLNQIKMKFLLEKQNDWVDICLDIEYALGEVTKKYIGGIERIMHLDSIIHSNTSNPFLSENVD